LARKPLVDGEKYIVREMFGCGEGHFLARFTHWEQGEACPHAHEPGQPNAYYHLYYRDFLVPEKAEDEKTDLWEKLNRDENVNKWGHLPLAG
jgi:hypothetical protein